MEETGLERMYGVSLTRMHGGAWQHRQKERQRQKPGGGKPPRPSGWSPDGAGCKDDERLYHRQGHRGLETDQEAGSGDAGSLGHCCPPPAGEQGLSG